MAIFGQDTFVEGAPPVVLTAHVPTGGTPGTGWVQRGSAVALVVSPSGWLSTAEKGSSRQVCQFNRATAWPADYTIKFSLKYLPVGANATNRIGVYGRMQGAATFEPGGIYFEVWRDISAATLHFTLFKIENDYTETTLATGGPIAEPASGSVDTYEVTFSGATVTASRNGSDLFGGVVAIDYAAGPPGVEYRVGDSSATTGTLIGPMSVETVVAPAAAVALEFGTQPAGFVTGTAPGVAPVVRALTAAGGLATGYTGLVTLAIASGPGVIGGTVSVAAVGGIATFPGVLITGVGAHTFAASAAGVAGTATSLTVVVAPALGTGVAGGFALLSSAALRFLLGPQTDPVSDTETPAIVRLSGNTASDPLVRAPTTIALGTPNPWAVSARLSGTVSYAGGAGPMTGVGTHFLTELAAGGGTIVLEIPAAKDPKGEGFYYLILHGAPTTDTSVPINAVYGGYFPAAIVGGAVAGVSYRREILNVDGTGFDGVIEKLMYYDFGYALYQSSYKHQDQVAGATIGDYADRIAKLWWDHPINATARRAGVVTDHGIIWPGSRHAALATFFTWALRGCPGASFPNTDTNVWAYAKDVATAAWMQWLEGHESYDHVPYDTRDGGYALHWCVMLSVLHPDATVRADFQAKALSAAINYFIRLQYADGTWRAPEAWRNCTTTLVGYPAMQPFLVALLVNALIDLHRSIKGDATLATQAATVLASIKQGIRGLMLAYGGPPHHAGFTAVTGLGSAPVRAFAYSYGGPDLGWDFLSAPGSGCQPLVPGSPDGSRWNDPKLNIEATVAAGTPLAYAVSAQRFLNSTSVHAPFYAALMSPLGSTDRSDFLSWGDELLNAQWEYTDGDGFRSQYDTPAPKNKDWDEHFRAQMRGIAWRKLVMAGAIDEVFTPIAPPLPGASTEIAALVIVTAPSAAKRMTPFTVQPVVKAVDENGATVTDFNGIVTAFKRGGRGTLRGTTSVRAVNGIATFTDLYSTLAAPILIGFYTLEVDA